MNSNPYIIIKQVKITISLQCEQFYFNSTQQTSLFWEKIPGNDRDTVFQAKKNWSSHLMEIFRPITKIPLCQQKSPYLLFLLVMYDPAILKFAYQSFYSATKNSTVNLKIKWHITENCCSIDAWVWPISFILLFSGFFTRIVGQKTDQ